MLCEYARWGGRYVSSDTVTVMTQFWAVEPARGRGAWVKQLWAAAGTRNASAVPTTASAKKLVGPQPGRRCVFIIRAESKKIHFLNHNKLIEYITFVK